MPLEVTRRRFVLQTLGTIGGTMVAGDLLPLLAEAAKRKQVLWVAVERDFETLRPKLSAGDTINMLRRFQELVSGDIGLVPLFTQFDNIVMREHVRGYVYYPDTMPVLANMSLM
jgi:hypothetical protein